MKSIYSIISAAIRPEIGERITIGLILVDEEKVYFEYSKDKVNVLKELINEKSYKFFKESLKTINFAVIKETAKIRTLFTEGLQNNAFSENYLDYLSRYSNNLINFSSPKTIEVNSDEQLFTKLFSKYIDDTTKSLIFNAPKDFELIKADFLPKVKKFYNLEYQLTPKEIPDLPIDIKVDLIGKNETIVYAQMIELERQPYHIQNDIGVLAILKQSFKNDTMRFAISHEPEKSQFAKQHEIWQHLRENKFAKYVDVTEIGLVEEYALKHGVQPLIAVNE